MKSNAKITTCLVFLLIFAVTGPVTAQTIAIGVKKGNTFDYIYAFLWESTNPALTAPAEYTESINTQWFRLKIIDTSGYLIHVETTIHFKDGTERTKNGTVDTNHQAISVPYGFLLIRANTIPNEKIYPSGSDGRINATLLKTYPDGEKETSHFVAEMTTTDTYEKTEIFFERTTGVALEYQFESRETSDTYETTIRETILLQSSGITAEKGNTTEIIPYAILLVVFVTIIAIVILIRKRRTHTSPDQPEQYDTVYSDFPEQE